MMMGGFSNLSAALGLIFYTDPGSGLLIWQVLAASALGLLFYARNAFRKFWARIRPSDTKDEQSSPGPENKS